MTIEQIAKETKNIEVDEDILYIYLDERTYCIRFDEMKEFGQVFTSRYQAMEMLLDYIYKSQKSWIAGQYKDEIMDLMETYNENKIIYIRDIDDIVNYDVISTNEKIDENNHSDINEVLTDLITRYGDDDDCDDDDYE